MKKIVYNDHEVIERRKQLMTNVCCKSATEQMVTKSWIGS